MTTQIIHPGHHHASAAEQHAQLVKNTQKWVAQTFFGTLLKQMREDPFKSEMFDGGRGGEAFGAMYDQELADHMGRSAGKPLVDSIVRKIEGANAYRKASRLSPSPGTPGEGRGEGDVERRTALVSRNHPHPNPLPEYRERELDAADAVRWTKP